MFVWGLSDGFNISLIRAAPCSRGEDEEKQREQAARDETRQEEKTMERGEERGEKRPCGKLIHASLDSPKVCRGPLSCPSKWKWPDCACSNACKSAAEGLDAHGPYFRWDPLSIQRLRRPKAEAADARGGEGRTKKRNLSHQIGASFCDRVHCQRDSSATVTHRDGVSKWYQ